MMYNSRCLLLKICEEGIPKILPSILEKDLSCEVKIVEWQDETDVLEVIDQWNPTIILIYASYSKLSQNIDKIEWDKISSPRIFILRSDNMNMDLSFLPLTPFDDFILAPFNSSEFVRRFKKVCGEPNNEDLVKQDLYQYFGMMNLIGKDPAFLKAVANLTIFAKSDASILITGETGTGKEVCARAIHYLSEKSSGPFIVFDSGAVPVTLMENELFGHKQGAFTDARTSEHGLLGEANNGTLFLDEIEALNLASQTKLLRLLQEKTYRSLGDNKKKQADVRIIAATNVDITENIKKGLFRPDLYYRFSLNLSLPPLRKRKDDIPLLTDHFIKKHTKKDEKQKYLSNAAIKELMAYDWPGNIRELENIILNALIFTQNTIIPLENINIPTPG